MTALAKEVAFYASSIVVKAVTDENGAFFELDVEYGGSWFSTEQMPRAVIEEIRAAAAHPALSEGRTFTAKQKWQESSVSFLVDRQTRIRDEWSFP